MAYFKCAFSNSGATLTVECDSFMAGAIVTCSNGVKTLQGLCPSTSPYEVTFKIPEEGTWVVSTTISGATYSTSVDIDFSFEASLSGFNWMRWLTEGGLDPSDYNDLSEVLADEKALRQLNIVHASVDYMASIIATHPDVETIIAEGLFAKWVNHSDYALDHMEANAVLSDLMDEADLYGYGELIEDNGSYVPKGNVPVMTSNSAPYGAVSVSSNFSGYDGYKAFDNDDSTYWNASTTNGTITYQFTNPVCPKRIVAKVIEATKIGTYKIQASNDGINFTDLTEVKTMQSVDINDEITTSEYYLYLRFNQLSVTGGSNSCGLKSLQFYGRELKVSVPIMTSNTAPYGEAIHEGAEYTGGGGTWLAYNSFNSTTTNYCEISSGDVRAVGYKATKKFILKMFTNNYNKTSEDNAAVTLVDIQGSNDGSTWETLASNLVLTNTTSNDFNAFTIDNVDEYLYHRAVGKSNGGSNEYHFGKLQFYGKDYSEKEFANNGSKWLYDHGVELEEMTALTSGNSSNVVEKKDNEVYMYKVGTNSAAGIYSPLINLSDYSLLRAKMGDKSYSSNSGEVSAGMLCVSSSTPIDAANMSNVNGYSDYYSSTTQGNLPNNLSLDVSSYNEGKYLSFVVRSAGNFTKYSSCTELWLE